VRAKSRKGLSPLVATVLLISATVIGGMLVYQYFQSSVAKAQGMGGGLLVTARAEVVSDNLSLVKVAIVNGENDVAVINASQIIFIDEKGARVDPIQAEGTSIGKIVTLQPGEKDVLIFAFNRTPAAVIVKYSVGGETYTSDPVTITK